MRYYNLEQRLAHGEYLAYDMVVIHHYNINPVALTT